MLFDPINLVVTKREQGWHFVIKQQRNAILVGEDTTIPLDKHPDILHRFSDARLVVSIGRRDNALYERRVLYGKSRRGWSSTPFVTVERPLVLEPKRTTV